MLGLLPERHAAHARLLGRRRAVGRLPCPCPLNNSFQPMMFPRPPWCAPSAGRRCRTEVAALPTGGAGDSAMVVAADTESSRTCGCVASNRWRFAAEPASFPLLGCSQQGPEFIAADSSRHVRVCVLCGCGAFVLFDRTLSGRTALFGTPAMSAMCGFSHSSAAYPFRLTHSTGPSIPSAAILRPMTAMSSG